MRLLVILAFLVCFLLLGFNVLRQGNQGKGPIPRALVFAEHVKKGDYKACVEDFGVNTCRCPGSLGWVSYLVYQSNEAQNLAFTFGKDFEVKAENTQARQIATTAKATTFMDAPEDWEVNLPVTFNPSVYAPYFLPLDMAYGYEMKRADFDAFTRDPDKDAWKGFTLRLRPSLEAGVVKLPDAAKKLEKPGHDAASIDKAVTGGENPDAEEIARNLFGDDAVKYLHPKDAAAVKDDNGNIIPPDVLAPSLPRLTACTIKLHMVRRDQRLPYSVFQFLVLDPVLTTEGGKTVALKNYLPPVYKDVKEEKPAK